MSERSSHNKSVFWLRNFLQTLLPPNFPALTGLQRIKKISPRTFCRACRDSIVGGFMSEHHCGIMCNKNTYALTQLHTHTHTRARHAITQRHATACHVRHAHTTCTTCVPTRPHARTQARAQPHIPHDCTLGAKLARVIGVLYFFAWAKKDELLRSVFILCIKPQASVRRQILRTCPSNVHSIDSIQMSSHDQLQSGSVRESMCSTFCNGRSSARYRCALIERAPCSANR